MNLDYFFIPYTKINSKWMKDLNVKQEAIKILEEKASKNLFDLSHSNVLLNMSPEANKSKNELLAPHQNKKASRDAWVAQSVKQPASAQVMISRSVGSSPAWGSVLTAQSPEPVSDSVSPSLSAPAPFMLCLSLS